MALVRVYLGFWPASVTYVCAFLFLLAEDYYISFVSLLSRCMVLMVLQNLLRREPLKLVDGGQSQRTFVYIKDAIEAVVLMIVCYRLCLWLLLMFRFNEIELLFFFLLSIMKGKSCSS